MAAGGRAPRPDPPSGSRWPGRAGSTTHGERSPRWPDHGLPGPRRPEPPWLDVTMAVGVCAVSSGRSWVQQGHVGGCRMTPIGEQHPPPLSEGWGVDPQRVSLNCSPLRWGTAELGGLGRTLCRSGCWEPRHGVRREPSHWTWIRGAGGAGGGAGLPGPGEAAAVPVVERPRLGALGVGGHLPWLS